MIQSKLYLAAICQNSEHSPLIYYKFDLYQADAVTGIKQISGQQVHFIAFSCIQRHFAKGTLQIRIK